MKVTPASRPVITVWITKYALTTGIQVQEAEVFTTGMICVRPEHPHSLPVYYHGESKDWHRTEDAAKAAAEKMRVKKIAALKKQIEKLQDMTF